MIKKRRDIAPFLSLFALLWMAVPVLGQEQGWEKKWNATIAAAKKERSVVVAGPPDPIVRRELPARFKARFGIPVEYIGGRGSHTAAKLRAERRARVYTVDVFMGGLSTIASILYPEHMLEPLKPLLFLPEVVDLSKWREGKLSFMDPEKKYVLRLFKFVSPLLYINTKFVKPEEFKSIKDLLNPKWKGKISGEDPTTPGAGGGTAVRFYAQFGEEFVKKFYIDQKPRITRDDRQITDWLARGTYPVSLNANEEDVERLRKEGFPLMAIYSFPDAAGRVTGGTGYLALMHNAPHSNAARLFANWIASKEGLEIYARGYLSATLRNDVDTSFLPPQVIPSPGENYFDSGDWKFTLTARAMRRRVRDILRK